MARGFESKSVQDQWQEAEAARDARKRRRKSDEEVQLEKKQESLQLSRTRILNEIQAATNEPRKAQLKAALEHLDAELAKL